MLLNLPWQIFLSMHLLGIFLALIKCASRLEIAFGLHLNLLRRYIIADFLSLGMHANIFTIKYSKRSKTAT